MSETRDTSLNRSIAETRSNNRNGKFSDTDVENDDNSLGTRWSITSDDITSTTSQSSCSSTDKDSSSQKATFVTLESASSHSSDYHTIATPDQYIINEELPDFEPTIAEACEEYSKLNARNIEDCAATVILDKNTVITVDFKEFAQISPYFRAAFYGGFSETKSKLLIFDRSKSEQFIKCCELLSQLTGNNIPAAPNLEWMTLKRAFETLDIASYLLIDPLLTLLSDVIISKMTASSLVLAYHIAEYRYVPLAQKLWKMIVREFDRLMTNNTFLMLSETEILKLLRDKHLNIKSNEETKMVRKWIASNDYDGEGAIHLREKLYGQSDASGFEIEPRLPNSILLASGGWSNIGPTLLVEALDTRAQRWVRSDIKLFEVPRAYHAVIKAGEHLFTIGGFNGAEYYRSTRKFSFSNQECVEVAPMYDQRCYVGCGLLDCERIIAVGGYNNHDRLKSAEIFHIPTNQWHRIAEMSLRRSDGQCVISRGVAYAIGGFDGMNCHATVEYYDPVDDKWLLMSDNMTSPRSGVGATTLEGILFICGGFDGTNRLQSCEFVDSREGKWHRLRSMNRQRSNFGIEVLNNQVVVAGGYGGMVGTIGETEAYDFRTNTWTELPVMNLRRSALYLTRIENHEIIEAFVRPQNSTS